MIARAVLAFVVAWVAALGVPTAAAQDASHAGIYVDLGEETTTECVAFDGEEITGEQLLRRADIDVVADSRALGTAVCRIDGVGCGADDCFCDYPSFWGYWTRDPQRGDDSTWAFSDVGASDRTVRNGSMDGWSFGEDGKPAPPDGVTFEQVCGQGATVAAASDDDAAQPRPDYAVFAGFAALLALLAVGVVAVRRRRTRPSGT